MIEEIPQINWWALSPLLAIVGAGLLELLWQITFKPKSNIVSAVLSVLGISTAISLTLIVWKFHPDATAFNRGVVFNGFTVIFYLLALGSALLPTLMTEAYLRARKANYGECYPLLLFATAGAMIMISSQDLIVTYLGLECLSIALYVLTGLTRSDQKSEEAAIKYLLLGALASAFLLYGIALLYGAFGTTRLDLVFRLVPMVESQSSYLVYAGLALLIVGVGFKTALVPFHMWTPDVYQGAPTNITAFMAATVKISAFAVLWLVVKSLFEVEYIWQPILMGLALVTMTFGNIAALVQTNAKRLLAYSSIAHTGYLLVGVISVNDMGLHAVMYYCLAYILVTLGSFSAISLMASNGAETTEISDMKGLWKRNSFIAVAMIIFMASLAGVPPTAGFFAKLGIFMSAIASSQSEPGPIGSAGHIVLAIAIAVNSAISLLYYMKLVVAMFVSEPDEAEPALNRSFMISFCAFVCMAGIIVAGIFYGPISAYIQKVLPAFFPWD